MGGAGAQVRRKAAARFFGLYRGVVSNNVDPEQQGRLAVVCPDVSGPSPVWALPCVPLTGPQTGLFGAPPVGAAVWLQFEAGAPDRPVCMGGLWPEGSPVPVGGGVRFSSPSGASLTISDAGVTLENGKGASIVLQGPAVTINNGALEIT